MRIAAYAPLKPPSHPVPSGDRRVARLIGRALELAGHDVEWPSRFRSRDGSGDRQRQLRLATMGHRLADRLIRRFETRPAALRPQAWLTYHLYYKAPDHLGPAVARALGIPYLVAEASVAAKRAGGPWDLGHRATLAALAQAKAVISLNPADGEALAGLLGPGTAHHLVAPFLDASAYPISPHRAGDEIRLLAIGMMRTGDKLASYRTLAAALAKVDAAWRLTIVGDGEARPAVEADFAGFGTRITFAGLCDDAAVTGHLAASDLFVWPAIGEAYGMAILEAQASGLPVVAGAMPGVAAIVAHGTTGLLAPLGDADAFAAAIGELCADADARRRMGESARAKVLRLHDLPAAAAAFDLALRRAA